MSDPNQPSRPDRIVISTDDLDSDPASGPPMGPTAGVGPLPPVSGATANQPPLGRASGQLPPVAVGGVSPGRVSVVSGGTGLAALGGNPIVAGLIAGAGGGLLGCIVAEVLTQPEQWLITSAASVRTQSGIWLAVIGLVLGFVLAAWDGAISGSARKAMTDGAVGAMVGAVSGFVGGYAAQWLYTTLLQNMSYSSSQSDLYLQQLMSRSVAWALFGGILGTGLGLRSGVTKCIHGAIGGLIGAGLGGAVFAGLAILAAEGDVSLDGFLLRLVGMTITGVGIGLGVATVERLMRSAWVVISAGPMRGKELILYKPQTTVGSDYHCDVVLVKDPTVASVHASFQRTGSTTTVRAEQGATVFVNGVTTAGQQLRPGDVITLGQSSITYQERTASTI